MFKIKNSKSDEKIGWLYLEEHEGQIALKVDIDGEDWFIAHITEKGTLELCGGLPSNSVLTLDKDSYMKVEKY